MSVKKEVGISKEILTILKEEFSLSDTIPIDFDAEEEDNLSDEVTEVIDEAYEGDTIEIDEGENGEFTAEEIESLCLKSEDVSSESLIQEKK